MSAKISLTSQISAQKNAINILGKSATGLRPAEQELLVAHLDAGLKSLQFIQDNLVAIREMLSKGDG